MLPTRKVQRWLYELHAYFSIFIGVTSYRYDYALKRYTNTKWTQLIASLANLCVVLLVTMDLYISATIIRKEGTEIALIVEATINNLFCLLSVLQRIPRERATYHIAEELRRQRHIYRYRWPRQDVWELQLDRLYLARNCVMWVTLAILTVFMMFNYTNMATTLRQPLLQRVFVVLYVLALDGQNVTMHMLFLNSWRICRLLERLNRRIEHLIKGNSAADTLALHHLSWQHWQLSELKRRLLAAYSFSIMTYRFSIIISAAALGYYITMIRSLDNRIIGFALFAFIVLDGYLSDLMAQWTMETHRKTSWLLRQQHDLRQPNAQLSRVCDLLALQMACFPLELKLYGIRACGKTTWLRSCVLSFSWLIVLLQYGIVAERKKLKYNLYGAAI